jgi:hypothetical protein
LPVEEDSLPLHVVGIEPATVERQVAKLVVEQPELLARYGGFLAGLHSKVWKEFEAMARTAKRELKFDLRPAIESLGLRTVLEQVGVDRVIEALGKKEVIRRIGVDDILANLSPAERQALKRRLQ